MPGIAFEDVSAGRLLRDTHIICALPGDSTVREFIVRVILLEDRSGVRQEVAET